MSSRTRFALAGAAAAVAALVVAVPSATAAPTKGGEFTVTCPGEDPFTVVVPGGGPFTPAFMAGTNQLLIPYEITGEITVGGEVVETFSDVKRAPVPASATTCSFTGTFTEDGTTVTISGTVVGVLRGR